MLPLFFYAFPWAAHEPPMSRRLLYPYVVIAVLVVVLLIFG